MNNFILMMLRSKKIDEYRVRLFKRSQEDEARSLVEKGWVAVTENISASCMDVAAAIEFKNSATISKKAKCELENWIRSVTARRRNTIRGPYEF